MIWSLILQWYYFILSSPGKTSAVHGHNRWATYIADTCHEELSCDKKQQRVSGIRKGIHKQENDRQSGWVYMVLSSQVGIKHRVNKTVNLYVIGHVHIDSIVTVTVAIAISS